MLPSCGNILTDPFGLNDRQGLGIVPEQDIIRIPYARLVGHSFQGILTFPILPLHPSGICQQRIDVNLSGFVFREIQRLLNIRLLLLIAPCGELFPQCLVFRFKLLNGYIRSTSLNRRRHSLFLLQKRRIKLTFLIALAIAVVNEIEENEQVFQCIPCLLLADGTGTVGGIVAQGTDKIQTLEDFPTDDFLKAFRIEERDQLFLIRHQ